MSAISSQFRKMADLIDRNLAEVPPAEGGPPANLVPENFGGCFVIVGPTGDAIERLILANSKDSAQFWGNLQAHAAIMIAKISDAERNTQAFGRGR